MSAEPQEFLGDSDGAGVGMRADGIEPKLAAASRRPRAVPTDDGFQTEAAGAVAVEEPPPAVAVTNPEPADSPAPQFNAGELRKRLVRELPTPLVDRLREAEEGYSKLVRRAEDLVRPDLAVGRAIASLESAADLEEVRAKCLEIAMLEAASKPQVRVDVTRRLIRAWADSVAPVGREILSWMRDRLEALRTEAERVRDEFLARLGASGVPISVAMSGAFEDATKDLDHLEQVIARRGPLHGYPEQSVPSAHRITQLLGL